MRVHVLYAHPVETSFCAALHEAVVTALGEAGHTVDDCDLYAEGFDPVMNRAERLGYHDLENNTRPVQAFVDRLQAAEGLVVVYPVWNYGYPAILKGYFDRVFLPGVSFRMADGVVRPNLHHIRRLGVVTTYGGARLKAFLAGDPPRRMATRTLRAMIKPGARVSYHAHYDMNRSTDESRSAFLHRVTSVYRTF